VNWNSKQASRLHNYTVQVDPWSTYPPSWETVALSASNAQVQKDGASWTFTGNVVNDSGKELSGETVVIAVLDAQNKLVATNYTFVWPEGDTFPNGATSNYEVTVYLDPNADTTGYTYQVLVQGDVK
jgi:archaellin